MILSRSVNTIVRAMLYDAQVNNSPTYKLRIYSRSDEEKLLEISCTDTSTQPAKYQQFTINKNSLQSIPPGNYRYRFVDTANSDTVLESGRVRISDNNDNLITYNADETIIRQTATT